MFFDSAWMQKKLVRFLLKRSIGPYVLDEIEVDQLTVNLGEGCITVDDLRLNVRVLNGLLHGLPVAVKSGTLGRVKVSIPWRDLFGGRARLTLSDVEIVAQPASQIDPDLCPDELPFESEQAATGSHYAPAERRDDAGWYGTGQGKQLLVSVCESIISKVEVHLENIVLRLEGETEHVTCGVSVRVDSLLYTDATPGLGVPAEDVDDAPPVLDVPFFIKHLVCGRVFVELVSPAGEQWPVASLGGGKEEFILRVKYRATPAEPGHMEETYSSDDKQAKYDVEWLVPDVVVIVCPNVVRWVLVVVALFESPEEVFHSPVEDARMGWSVEQSVYQSVEAYGFSQRSHFFVTNTAMSKEDMEVVEELVEEYRARRPSDAALGTTPLAMVQSLFADESDIFADSLSGEEDETPGPEASVYHAMVESVSVPNPPPRRQQRGPVAQGLTSTVAKVRISNIHIATLFDIPPAQQQEYAETCHRFLAPSVDSTNGAETNLSFQHFGLRLANTTVKARLGQNGKDLGLVMNDFVVYEAIHPAMSVNCESVRANPILSVCPELSASTPYNHTSNKHDYTNHILSRAPKWSHSYDSAKQHKAARVTFRNAGSRGYRGETRCNIHLQPLLLDLDVSAPLRLGALVGQMQQACGQVGDNRPSPLPPMSPAPENSSRSAKLAVDTEGQHHVTLSFNLTFIRAALHIPSPTPPSTPTTPTPPNPQTAANLRPTLQQNIVLVDLNGISGELAFGDLEDQTSGRGSVKAQGASFWLVEGGGATQSFDWEKKGFESLDGGRVVGDGIRQMRLAAVFGEGKLADEGGQVVLDFVLKKPSAMPNKGGGSSEGLVSQSKAMAVMFGDGPILAQGRQPPPSPFSYACPSFEDNKKGTQRRQYLTTAEEGEGQEFRNKARATSLAQVTCGVPCVAVLACKRHLDAAYALYADWLCWAAVVLGMPQPPSSDSDSDEAGSDQDDPVEVSSRLAFGGRAAKQLYRPRGPTGWTVEVNIGRVCVSLEEDHTSLQPSKKVNEADSFSKGEVGPESPEMWRFDAEVGDVQIFAAMDYLGLPVKYLCFSGVDLSLFATFQNGQPSTRVALLTRSLVDDGREPEGSNRGRKSVRIAGTVDGKRSGLSASKPDTMLAVTALMNLDRTKNVKGLTLSVDLRQSRLLYQPIDGGVNLLSRLLVFADLPEPTLPEYTPPSLIQSLFVNITNVSVEARPLFDPGRLVVSIGGLHIAKNTASGEATTSLPMLLQQVSVSVINRPPTPVAQLSSLKGFRRGSIPGSAEKQQLEAQGYVQVVTADFLELLAKLTERTDGPPVFDFEITNQRVEVSACRDSFQVLSNLLSYYAEDRDHPRPVSEEKEEVDEPMPEAEGLVQEDLQLDELLMMPQAHAEAPLQPTTQPPTEPTQTPPVTIERGWPPNPNTDYTITGLSSKTGNPGASVLLESVSIPRRPIQEPLVRLDGAYVEDLYAPPPNALMQEWDYANTNSDTEMEVEGVPQSAFHPADAQLLLHDSLTDRMDTEVPALLHFPDVSPSMRHPRPIQPSLLDDSLDDLAEVDLMAKSPKREEDLDATYEFVHYDSLPEVPPSRTRRMTVEDQVHVLEEDFLLKDRFDFHEDHFAVPPDDPDPQPGGSTLEPIVRIRMCDGSVFVNLYGGTDWTNDPKTSGRNGGELVTVMVQGLNADFQQYAEGKQYAWRGRLHLDIEAVDRVATSDRNKLLCYWRSDMHPRAPGTPMVRCEMAGVRPRPERSDVEVRLKLVVLPILFNVHQDTMDMLVTFFSASAADSAPANPPAMLPTPFRASQTPTATPTQPPPTTGPTSTAAPLHGRRKKNPKNSGPYIQYANVQAFKVRLDYGGKRVDFTRLTNGNMAELLNLVALVGGVRGASVDLPEVKVAGIQGPARLPDAVLAAWLPHIRQTQLPKLITGIGPIRSLVNVSTGVVDLVRHPVEQYSRDQRLMPGLQRGVASFVRNVGREALGLTTSLTSGATTFLEVVDTILAPDAPTDTQAQRTSPITQSATQRTRYGQQPSTFTEGVYGAYDSLSRELSTTATKLLLWPVAEYQQTGAQGAVRRVVRAVPVVFTRPAIGVTNAINRTLQGIQSTIDPEARCDNEEKLRRD